MQINIPNPLKLKTPPKIGFYPILLFAVILIICIKNYVPGTFLTGWDTLHPEFNMSLYWHRILGGVWQEHQGLGAVASQSHASEIPRILVLTLINIFFGVNFTRYAYAFLMLFLGPFGVYFFLKDVLLRKFQNSPRHLGSFIGALFYSLNLGTLQHFYVPLEMFLTHFGFLGWYMWSSSSFYQTGKRKFLLLFFLFTLFGASQAHTSTLFYAYFIYFAAYFSIVLLSDLSQRKVWKPQYVQRTTIILISTLLINLFWLLPNTYFALNHGGEVNMSKIHSLFSNEAFLANKKYGGTQDVTILRSFLFGWGEHAGNAQYGELLEEWIRHLDSPGVLFIGYGMFIFSCLGIVVSLIRREKFAFGVFAFFAIGIFFLFNVNPPFGGLFVLLQETVPLFKEAFRFPFTKFSIGLMFAYSAFFGYALAWYSNLFYRITQKVLLPKFVHGSVLIATTALLIYYMWPAFAGNLISPSMKVNIPDRYFEMFKYFDSQKEYGRVADFPVHSFWGWMYYDWDPATRLGYQGAGFLWFGIKQPLLNREFDRWNLLNEQYYREMSYAVYSRNAGLFLETLDKYKIRWLLLDESVMVPAADEKQLFYGEIKKLFADTGTITLARDFGNGLYVYEYQPAKTFARAETFDEFYPVGDTIYKEPWDTIYSYYQPYVNTGEEAFPYVGITHTDETLKEEHVQVVDGTIFINPKFVTGDASVSGAEEIGSSAKAKVPLVGVFERQAGSGGFKFTVKHISSGKELWTGSLGNAGEVPADIPVMISVNNDPRGLFFEPNDLEPKETNFYYTVGGSDSNTVSLYTMEQGEPLSAERLGELEPCSGLYELSSYEVRYLTDGFTLIGEGVKACLTLPISSFLEGAASPIYVLKTEVEPDNPYSICIFSDMSGLCENFYRDGAHMFTISDDISHYFLRFNSNALGREGPVSSTFKNTRVYRVKDAVSSQLVLDASEVLTPFVSEPYKVDADTSFGGGAVDLDHYHRYCNMLKNQEDVPSLGSEPGVLTYSSQENAVCDSFPFPYLPQNTGYLLEIRARNVAGAPLRVCLTNEFSKRCDLYVELPKRSGMQSYYYLIPSMGDEMGYTVNFSNLVFGSDYTENQLEAVRMTPIPHDYLRNYHTEVISEEGSKLLVLNEAYEKGWVAWCGIAPCKARHVTVNNWANGWIFDSGRGVSGVKFIFWPEVFEYVGLLILVPLGFYFFRYKEVHEE